MKKPENIYLIDGHSYIYRAYHAIQGLTNSRGFPTNAIYGFINMLRKLLKEKEPDAVAVSFDSPVPTERHRVYREYKAHRPQAPDDLLVQMPYIRKIVSAFNIAVFEIPGYEADDVLATLARRSAKEGIEAYIVTGDKDMMQVLDEHISIYDPMKDRTVTEDDVLERFGVSPGRIPEIMALTGDTVDNIPGVKGVGEKTAVAILKNNSIEEILERPDLIEKERLRKLITENTDLILMSQALAVVDSDVPLEFEASDCILKEPDREELLKLFREFEFGRLVSEMVPPEEMKGVCSEILELDKLRERLEGIGKFISISVEPAGRDPVDSGMAGVAFSVKEGESYYVPVSHHYLGAPLQLSASPVVETLCPILQDEEIKKTGHNIKSDIMLLRNSGCEIRGPLYDVMIASYLLNPNRQGYGLDELALEYLNIRRKSLKELLHESGTFAEASIDDAIEYAGSNAVITSELKDILFRRLSEEGLGDTYFKMEMPLIRVLADMELAGIKLDVELLKNISVEFEAELSSLKAQIYKLAGEEFNINSPKQLSRVLFQSLGLKPLRKTKTGYSTDVGVLEELSKEHDLPKEILNWRSLSKLKNTYVDALPRLVKGETGRIHTTFNQAATATGRLSSSNPNLQNIPIRGEQGIRIRGAFIADEGNLLLSADYSQIELRILAHLSRDEGFIDSFIKDGDIHTRTAMELFNTDEAGVTVEMRRAAKTVNFGVVYGISAYGLSESIGVTIEDAGLYIENFFQRHPGVRNFSETITEEALKLGYVRTLFGRKRQIPELRSSNLQQRQLGERLAMNTPIQGTAADVIKKAMINIYERLHSEGLKSRMILQVHDELVFEVIEDELEAMSELVRHEMENAVSLDVPIKVDVGSGKNWAEAHS